MFDPSIDPLYPVLHHMLPTDHTPFYPYSPNEVKHRRRTTTVQLQTLEAVFTVDTKPNATRRNELAAQLGMTARGVQVWFQNRRAKEKNKLNKKSHGAPSAAVPCPAPSSSTDPTMPSAELSPKEEDELDAASPPPATPKEEPLEEPFHFDLSHSIPPSEHLDSHFNSPSPTVSYHPPLRVVTDPALRPSSATSWKPLPPDQTPPDSAALPSRQSLIINQRRSSLPANMVNAHPRAYPMPAVPQSIDSWDTHDRRRSVDVGLQRLGKNPYAEITRTRNAVLNRQSSFSGRKSSLRRPFLPHQPPSSKYLDMRRASMDPRSLMPSRTDGLTSSSSPFPLRPIRASLPDTSSRATLPQYVREIRDPPPAGFTFGAASATQDEPASPDLSSYSFPAKDEDDDAISSFSFGGFSRFGSTTSIATSESSVFSKSSFYDIGDIAPDQERRNSCGSVGSMHHGQVPNMTAGPKLDGAISPLQNPNRYTDGYLDKSILLAPRAHLESQTQVHDSPLVISTFSSPTPSLSGLSTTHLSTTSANITVSNSSELVAALRSVSGSPQIPNGEAPSSEEQQPSGRSIQADLSPIEQQLLRGHQSQAIEGDDCTEPRISTVPRNDRSVVSNSVASQNIAVTLPGNERYETAPFQDRSPLTGSRKQLSDQSDYPAQYLGLMENLSFDSPLTVIDGEPGGQSKGRSNVPAVCDPLTRAGPETDTGDYITNTFSNTTTSEIPSNDPIFDAVFGP